jgi:thiamine-phosphate pyrophosphorylase
LKIYAICDFELIKSKNISLEEYVCTCNKYNVSIIQYRDKNSSTENIEKNLKILRKLWDKTLIINDKIELVKYCDGLHIGQEDLLKYKDIKSIRDIIGFEKMLGLSTHNEDEILDANNLGINYIGLGAYRNTNTKSDISNILGDKISSLAKLSNKDVVGIGGIKLSDNIPNIAYHAIGSDLLKDF